MVKVTLITTFFLQDRPSAHYKKFLSYISNMFLILVLGLFKFLTNISILNEQSGHAIRTVFDGRSQVCDVSNLTHTM